MHIERGKDSLQVKMIRKLSTKKMSILTLRLNRTMMMCKNSGYSVKKNYKFFCQNEIMRDETTLKLSKIRVKKNSAFFLKENA